MSRADERRKKREDDKATKQLNMTWQSFESSLQVAREQERERILLHVVRNYSTALAIVLHDKWGFGKTRLKRVLLQIADTYDNITLGYVKEEELRAIILEETGLDLDKRIGIDS